jgi:hypothetical protein
VIDVGEETFRGTTSTPDQDVFEESGEAVGLTYVDDEPLHSGKKRRKRDNTMSEDRMQFATRPIQPSGLIAIHAKSGLMITTAGSSWVDKPQMRGRVTIKEFSLLAVTFYSDTNVSADKRLFARA